MKTLILTLALLTTAIPSAFSGTLFNITKSSNRNQVLYDLNGKEVITYWRMDQTDGHIEDLTSYERKHVYGANITFTEGMIQIAIKALPVYPITVKLGGAVPTIGTMHLLGLDRVVKTVHLELSGGLIPGVRWIEVICQKNPTESETVILKQVDDEWTEKMKD